MIQRLYEINIRRMVQVDVDEEKMDSKFLEEFSAVMWKVKGIEEVLRHVALLSALEDREIGVYKDEFIEGIGSTAALKLITNVVNDDVEIQLAEY